MSWVPSLSAALLLSMSSPALAQRLADLKPAGVVQHRPGVETWRPTQVSVTPKPRTLWPWFALGGAVAGAGTIVVMAAMYCDAGCRDDGGWGYVPYYAAAGAGVGALAGAVVGVIVDLSRRENARTRNSGR